MRGRSSITRSSTCIRSSYCSSPGWRHCLPRFGVPRRDFIARFAISLIAPVSHPCSTPLRATESVRKTKSEVLRRRARLRGGMRSLPRCARRQNIGNEGADCGGQSASPAHRRHADEAGRTLRRLSRARRRRGSRLIPIVLVLRSRARPRFRSRSRSRSRPRARTANKIEDEGRARGGAAQACRTKVQYPCQAYLAKVGFYESR